MMPGATALYEEALRNEGAAPRAAAGAGTEPGGEPALLLRTSDGRCLPMEVRRWCAPPDPVDSRLLSRCRGPVIDVGCGPGRLTLALSGRGVSVLGVDIAPAAVARLRQAGAPVLHRSVFDPLPAEGRWATVLLADGNIGIGGHPVRLLRRCAELAAPGGQILVEAGPGDLDERTIARLEFSDGRRGPEFEWALAGTGAVLRAAADAGLAVAGTWTDQGRSFVRVLR